MICGGLRLKGVVRKTTETKPLITVITVVYNGERTLEKTILSVITQTYKNIEYIIIDGNSNDSTLEIIKKYEDKIDYWQSEPDKGIYDAMNKGIRLASGDFIALLNADDWYEDYTCMTVVDSIISEKADIYYGMDRIIDQYGHILKILGSTHHCLDSCCIEHPTCFISKNVYKSLEYDLNYKSAADYDFFCNAKEKNFSFFFIEKILTNFRYGGMSSNPIGMCETYKVRYTHGYIPFYQYFVRVLLLKLKMIIKRG